jgi:hypothetical protein
LNRTKAFIYETGVIVGIEQKWSTTNPETVFSSSSRSARVAQISASDDEKSIFVGRSEGKKFFDVRCCCHKNTSDYVAKSCFTNFGLIIPVNCRRVGWGGGGESVQVIATDAISKLILYLSLSPRLFLDPCYESVV